MRILIAEDEPLQRLLLETVLTELGHEVILTKNGHEALAVLDREEPARLAILDWMMPGIDGVQICRRIRAQPTRPYVYILLLTSRNQRRDLIEAFDAGVDDYLPKPVEPVELKARLRAGIRILELEERLVAANETLRLQGMHDSLTGLLNRAAIVDVLQRELARSLRENTPVGVVLIDVDYFKKINDNFGHAEGDVVLQEISRKMRSSVRVYDSVGRYGGEEFLIVLPGCNTEETRERAERIRDTINKQGMGKFGQTTSVSVGATAASKSEDYQHVLRIADAALYRAKWRGRNRVEIADDLSNEGAQLPQ
jgi:two-component system cell cycle response regulator